MASVYSSLLLLLPSSSNEQQTQVPDSDIIVIRDVSGVFNLGVLFSVDVEISPDQATWYSVYRASNEAGAPGFHQEMRVVVPPGFWIRAISGGGPGSASCAVSGYVLSTP